MRQTDFLVIGSGIAGLTYALKVAHHFPDKKVLVMTKAAADETNTKYAQGGIAVVNDMEHDSFEKHIEDTLIAGDGLCNEKVVEIVVKEGPERVKAIIVEQLGVPTEEVVESASFIEDLGADSLDIVELVMALEEEYDIEISDEDAEKIQTVGDAINYIQEHSA